MSFTKSLIFLTLLVLVAVASGRVRKQKQVDRKRNWLPADAPLVNLEVYYETLCPDSRAFINQQLYPTAQKIGSIMNITMYPYGNAKETEVNGEWVFTCQHGPNECATNLITTCALAQQADQTRLSKDLLEFIYCDEVSDDPTTSVETCANKVGLDWNAITACAGSDTGNQLEHAMALKTDALNPPHNWVPWIVLNSVHNSMIQAEAVSDLIQLICDTYTGTRPQACPP